MSCFNGQMNEYTRIAIDRFDGKNLLCTAFFLSHCHTDHMIGLKSPAFLDHLNSRSDLKLYCSEISCLLLLADEDFAPLEKFIQVLNVSSSQPIRIPGYAHEEEDGIVHVTLIPAAHCPGSVMFLFEGSEGNVLYTGDFRWEKSQAAKMAALHNSGKVKDIKSLYVDTTFCITEAFHIPSRQECVEAIVTLVSGWLSKSCFHVVSISCPARYGHEHLLMELARRLDVQIHVTRWKVDLYNNIPDLQGLFTSDPKSTRVHACSVKSGMPRAGVLPCGDCPSSGDRYRVLNVRPSTMWFTSGKSKSSPSDLIVAPASLRGVHRICYSMHSSYSEIRDLVSYLQPKRVLPNVQPSADSSMATVQARLNSFLDFPNKSKMESEHQKSGLNSMGALRMVEPKLGRGHDESLDSSDDLVFSSQEKSPIKANIRSDPKLSMMDSDSFATENPGTDLTKAFPVKSSDESQNSSLSYSGSLNRGDEELDLFSDNKNSFCIGNDKIDNELNDDESLRLYVSGESELSDEEEEENDVKKIVGNDNKIDGQKSSPAICEDVSVMMRKDTPVSDFQGYKKTPVSDFQGYKDTPVSDIHSCKNTPVSDFQGYKDTQVSDIQEEVCSSDSNSSDVIPNSQESMERTLKCLRKDAVLTNTSDNGRNRSASPRVGENVKNERTTTDGGEMCPLVRSSIGNPPLSHSEGDVNPSKEKSHVNVFKSLSKVGKTSEKSDKEEEREHSVFPNKFDLESSNSGNDKEDSDVENDRSPNFLAYKKILFSNKNQDFHDTEKQQNTSFLSKSCLQKVEGLQPYIDSKTTSPMDKNADENGCKVLDLTLTNSESDEDCEVIRVDRSSCDSNSCQVFHAKERSRFLSSPENVSRYVDVHTCSMMECKGTNNVMPSEFHDNQANFSNNSDTHSMFEKSGKNNLSSFNSRNNTKDDDVEFLFKSSSQSCTGWLSKKSQKRKSTLQPNKSDSEFRNAKSKKCFDEEFSRNRKMEEVKGECYGNSVSCGKVHCLGCENQNCKKYSHHDSVVDLTFDDSL